MRDFCNYVREVDRVVSLRFLFMCMICPVDSFPIISLCNVALLSFAL